MLLFSFVKNKKSMTIKKKRLSCFFSIKMHVQESCIYPIYPPQQPCTRAEGRMYAFGLQARCTPQRRLAAVVRRGTLRGVGNSLLLFYTGPFLVFCLGKTTSHPALLTNSLFLFLAWWECLTLWCILGKISESHWMCKSGRSSQRCIH